MDTRLDLIEKKLQPLEATIIFERERLRMNRLVEDYA